MAPETSAADTHTVVLVSFAVAVAEAVGLGVAAWLSGSVALWAQTADHRQRRRGLAGTVALDRVPLPHPGGYRPAPPRRPPGHADRGTRTRGHRRRHGRGRASRH